VVAAEDEWQVAACLRSRDQVGDALAGRLDLVQEAGVLVAERDRLGHGRDDVPPVLADPPELGDPRVEARVADRRRSHVDAAAPLPQIERCPDDRNRRVPVRPAHRCEGYFGRRRCRPPPRPA
jgi:hypothetical protein